jgi:hypothetical protein
MATKPLCCTRISSPPGPFFWIRIALPGAVATIDAPGGAGGIEEMHAGLTGGTSIGRGCRSAFAPPALRISPSTIHAMNKRPPRPTRLACRRQVRRVFLVTLIPRAFSHALCSARALVSAAVLGRLVGLPFGVDIMITRDIGLGPAGCVGI